MRTKFLISLSLSVFVLILLCSFVSATDYTETFENATPEISGSYGNGSFVGDNEGITWNYVESRNEGEYAINGKGLMLKNSTSKITSNTISGGIASFSVKLKKGFIEDGDRQVGLYIDGDLKETSDAFDDNFTHSFEVLNINLEGGIIIELRNIRDTQIVIDDITWTDYTEPTSDYDFCEGIENIGGLVVEIEEINIKQGFGEDDADGYWYLFDEIEVELNIEPGNWDIENIEVKWELYAGDKRIMKGDEKDFDLDEDDDDETVTFSFKLDKKISAFEGEDAILYIRAKGKIDNKGGEHDNKDTCVQISETVEVITNDDFVILDDIQINGLKVEYEFVSESISCGAELQITADVWNIGDDNQEDVTVLIHSDDLKINKKVEFDKIKKFDDEGLEVTLALPEDLKEGTYLIKFTIYDEDNDVYETDEEEDKSEFKVYLKIEGNCYTTPTAVISGGSIESGGKAGQMLVVKASITNTGEELTSYNLNVAGFADWASSGELDQESIILKSGEAKDVLINLDVKRDVEGEKSFNLEVLSGNEVVVSKQFLIPIEKSSGLFSGLTGGAVSEGNWYLWGIGALNIILVIIIILVAVRVARK